MERQSFQKHLVSGQYHLPCLRGGVNENNKRSITRRVLFQPNRGLALKPVLQIILRNCSGEAGFSAQFYILPEQRTLNKVGTHVFKFSEKQTSVSTRSTYSMVLAPGKGILSSKEEAYLISISNTDIPYFWPGSPFL